MSKEDLEILFDEIFFDLYDGKEDPYDGHDWCELGVTATMVLHLAKRKRLALHVVWGDNTKILCYSPANKVGCLCTHVFGDHGFFVEDPHAKSVIAKMKIKAPKVRPEVIQKIIMKSCTPPVSEWKEFRHLLNSTDDETEEFRHSLNSRNDETLQ